jgi:CRISPR-associated protein Cas5/CasD subtype I-E
MNNYLSLYLDSGISQSWGYGSNLQFRPTKPYPTQSGVTGMICRASHHFVSKIGREKYREFLQKINDGAKFFSFQFTQNGFIRDFQTIGTNYKRNFLKKATGADHFKDKLPITVVMSKQFLQDAVSGCIIFHDDEAFLQEIAEYIRSPLSIIGIGRMRCVPCSPVYNSIDSSLIDSFCSLVNRVNSTRKTFTLEEDSVVKVVYPDIHGYSINDVMVDDGVYLSRIVREEDKSIKEIREDIQNGRIS